MARITPGALVAIAMLAEKLWRHCAVTRFFERRPPLAESPVRLVSILQPILSGDPTMPACLEANLAMQTACSLEFIWLVDTNDLEADRVCRELIEKYPHRRIHLHAMPPPGERDNPKMVKLIRGLDLAEGDVICVLDDDTVLPHGGLDLCIPYLDQPGVGLAFGLPYYTNFSNLWSSLVSYFVNSHSLLTYIPYTTLTKPFTINGMFYCVKRHTLDSVGGFRGSEATLADDFAVAQRFKQHGLKLAQTPLLHGISTRVTGPRHYLSLIQRWFIFPRESLMRHLGLRDRTILYVTGLLPALYPLLLVIWTLKSPSTGKSAYALAYFAYSFALFVQINNRYLRGAAPMRTAWLVPLIQVFFPVQLVAALLSPRRIVWRGHVMQVEKGGGFRFVRRREITSTTRQS
jgi:ceramide glucosyltransferase